MSRTIIPKDCCVCDFCNTQLTDEKFIALDDCFWYEGWLLCNDCYGKRPDYLKLIREIRKGEDLSNTELASPIIMDFDD